MRTNRNWTLLCAASALLASTACKPKKSGGSLKSVIGVDAATGLESTFGVFAIRRVYPTLVNPAAASSATLQQSEMIARNPYLALIECVGGDAGGTPVNASQMLDLVRERSEPGVGDLWLNGNGDVVVSRDLKKKPVGNGVDASAQARTSCKVRGRLMTWDVFQDIFARMSKLPATLPADGPARVKAEATFSAAMSLHLAVRGPFRKGQEGRISKRFLDIFNLAAWWRGDRGLSPTAMAKAFIANDRIFNPCIRPSGALAQLRDQLMSCVERKDLPGTFIFAAKGDKYTLLRNRLESEIANTHNRIYASVNGLNDPSLIDLINETTKTGSAYIATSDDGGGQGLALAGRGGRSYPASTGAYYGGAPRPAPRPAPARPSGGGGGGVMPQAASGNVVSARWGDSGKEINVQQAQAIPSIGGRFDKDQYVKQFGEEKWNQAVTAYGLDPKTTVGFNGFMEDKAKSAANPAFKPRTAAVNTNAAAGGPLAVPTGGKKAEASTGGATGGKGPLAIPAGGKKAEGSTGNVAAGSAKSSEGSASAGSAKGEGSGGAATAGSIKVDPSKLPVAAAAPKPEPSPVDAELAKHADKTPAEKADALLQLNKDKPGMMTADAATKALDDTRSNLAKDSARLRDMANSAGPESGEGAEYLRQAKELDDKKAQLEKEIRPSRYEDQAKEANSKELDSLGKFVNNHEEVPSKDGGVVGGAEAHAKLDELEASGKLSENDKTRVAAMRASLEKDGYSNPNPRPAATAGSEGSGARTAPEGSGGAATASTSRTDGSGGGQVSPGAAKGGPAPADAATSKPEDSAGGAAEAKGSGGLTNPTPAVAATTPPGSGVQTQANPPASVVNPTADTTFDDLTKRQQAAEADLAAANQGMNPAGRAEAQTRLDQVLREQAEAEMGAGGAPAAAPTETAPAPRAVDTSEEDHPDGPGGRDLFPPEETQPEQTQPEQTQPEQSSQPPAEPSETPTEPTGNGE